MGMSAWTGRTARALPLALRGDAGGPGLGRGEPRCVSGAKEARPAKPRLMMARPGPGMSPEQGFSAFLPRIRAGGELISD